MVEGFKNTEVGIIPNDWNLRKIGECIQKNPDYGINAAAVPFNEGLPVYLRITDITEDGQYSKKNIVSVNNTASLSFLLQEGDLVFARTGASVGKSYLYNSKDGELVFAGFLIRVKTNNEILIPAFLKYFTQTNLYWNWIAANSMRTGQPGINGNEFKELIIPLPPTKSEQTAIATVLSDADVLINQLEKLITKKKAIKQVMSSDLLSGRKRLGDNTKKWKEETIESLCKVFTKQTGFDYSAYIKPSLIKTYEEGVLPFIQNKDFYGRKINLNTDYFIPYLVAKNFPRILLDEKCLLISISGSVGHVGVFNEKRHAFLGGAIAVAKFIDKSKIDWAMYFLQSPLGQSMLLAKVKTGSHQNLILDDIRKMIIPYPPKDEMNQIISILFDIDLEIEMLETKLEKQKQLKQGMMQSLLTGKIRLV
jgi:type I restriction enzyme S subunit